MLESQKVLLQLLKEIDEICKKHDITYYLVGGSALGAVRHHGFLPWDDDADIVMDHVNYMKFVEVMSDPRNMPSDRAYEDPFIEPYTQLNVFGRYSATDTTCIFNVLCLCDSAHGIKVDVFHMIPCPDEGPERDEFMRKFHVWGELCHPYARYRNLDVAEWRSGLEKMEKYGIGEIRKKMFDELHIEKYVDCSQYLYCYEMINHFYNKDIFREPVYFPFEDTWLPVPTKYAEHFRHLFGDDWFCIPEDSEIETHLIVQDEHRSYKEYTSDYFRYVSKEPEKLFHEYKYRVYLGWEKEREVSAHKTYLRKKVVEEKIRIFWNNYSDQVRTAFSENDYEKVLSITAPYTDEQFNTLSKTHELFYEVDNDLFHHTVASFLYLSENKKARWLLSHATDKFNTADIISLHKLLDGKDRLIKMEEDGQDPLKLLEIIESLLLIHNNDRDLHLRKASIMLQTETAYNNNASELMRICGNHPNDGDFIALLAKFYEKHHDVNKAIDHYVEAASKTRNGMVIMECRLSLDRLRKVMS